ncbi:glycosyltransferase family A protein [Leifsonia sp. 2MCAF36]|uniref:glycosyltransferase family A protein n=1 Tax=Leifsonia sp. 2MCAF36 TaxID=3232988 RepID=UPI003F9D2C32
MGSDVGVVVTTFNQGRQTLDTVESVLAQTRQASVVVVVDDGSSDEDTRRALEELPSGVVLIGQSNAGVAAARNRGIHALRSDLIAVIDGDDLWEPTFLEQCCGLLEADDDCVIASSELRTFGVASHRVRPAGGRLVDFLHRNASPASAVFRRSTWRDVGGYAESMRNGFEDWDFFLSVLERDGMARIVPEPLLRYRTHPASLNMTSMQHREELFRTIIGRHREAFQKHLDDVLVALERTSMQRLARWEALAVRENDLEREEPSFGDGGMASAVRISTARATSDGP